MVFYGGMSIFLCFLDEKKASKATKRVEISSLKLLRSSPQTPLKSGSTNGVNPRYDAVSAKSNASLESFERMDSVFLSVFFRYSNNDADKSYRLSFSLSFCPAPIT